MPPAQRLQATLPAPVMEQLQRLREELGLVTSDIVREAIDLFAKAVLEAKRGARLASTSSAQPPVVREYSSPTLTRLEWDAYAEQENIVLPDEDFDKLAARIESPPPPTPALRELSRKRRRKQP